MSRIPMIDIADVNCWLVYLMPVNSEQRTNYDLIDKMQQECIKRKIFGMGWDIEIPEYSTNTPMNAENAEIYMKRYNEANSDWPVSGKAVTAYMGIKKNDYIVMRLKNGHFYAGRVSSDGAYYIYDKNDEVQCNFSWGCSVEKWVEYKTENEVPSELVGRFSQRRHSTIQRVSPYRQRLLVISMYENALPESQRKFSIPKLRIGKQNFVRSLNYKELEDLVAVYIYNKHHNEGYCILPSSCKVSQQNYEFSFIASGKKPITCQVKNQRDVPIDHYLADSHYEKVYIFSGKWSEAEVLQKRKDYKDYPHIYIISPSELYEVMKKERLFENKYFDYHDSRDLNTIVIDGYNKCKSPKKERDYSASEDYICFEKKDGLFYTAEFDALVLSWHIFPLDQREYEKECCERVYADLNLMREKKLV